MFGLFFASFFFDKFGAVMTVCAALLTAVYGIIKRFSRADHILIVFSFAAAVTVNRLYTELCYDKIVSYAGSCGSFCGEVTDYDIYDGDLASYVLKGKINDTQKAEITLLTNELDADYGDILSIESCNFKEFESDYLFDSKLWNKSRHIYLEADKIERLTVTKTDSAKLRRVLSDFREHMVSELRVEMGSETGGFLSGMLFGEKQYMEDNVRTSLYRTGIGHILAVSGLHVSIIAAVFMRLMKSARINKYIRFGVVNCIIALLIMTANYPISAIRAALMLDMMYSAELFGQQNDSFNSLSISALAICLCDPYAVYSSGFILSLSGTFGIAVFSPYMSEKFDSDTLFGKLGGIVSAAVCTSLAVMPASVYYFDETSLIAPLANILLVPLCTVSMILGLIFILTGGIFSELLIPAEMMLTAVLKIADITSSVGAFSLPQTCRYMPVLFFTSAALTVFIYLFSGKRSAVAVTVAAAIALNFTAAAVFRKYRDDRLTVAVLGKSGQCAAVISYDGRTIVADLSGHNKTAAYVKKYLTENGFADVDSLILNTAAQSQYSVYIDELKYFPPNNVYVSGTEIIGGKSESFGEKGMSARIGEYDLELSDNVLTLSVGETELLLLSAAHEYEEQAEITVYWGKTKPEERRDGCIYLTDINNFEILFEMDGEYGIRRL
ncbi:MAG: ComEC/Rec2 family competence protein [Ruminococcus sp.]|nr:ComEC/Rec2 family competence protein [Ruminococcus sp.]